MLYGRRVDRRSALADHISVSLFSLAHHHRSVSRHRDFSMLIIYLFYLSLLLAVARDEESAEKFIRMHQAITHDV